MASYQLSLIPRDSLQVLFLPMPQQQGESSAASSLASPQGVRVATLNIGAATSNSHVSDKKRPEFEQKLMADIAALTSQADVICLQEVAASPWQMYIVDKTLPQG